MTLCGVCKERKIHCKNKCLNCYQKAYRAANPEQERARRRKYKKAWREANPEKHREKARLWAEANRAKCRASSRSYQKRNPSKFKAYVAKRRAAKLHATPKWADLKAIEAFYKNCPEGCHVDHIIPLQSDFICGLHTLGNLQYLPALENQRKSNKVQT